MEWYALAEQVLFCSAFGVMVILIAFIIYLETH